MFRFFPFLLILPKALLKAKEILIRFMRNLVPSDLLTPTATEVSSTNSLAPTILFWVNVVLGIVFFIVYLMQNIHLIVGTFTKHKKFKKAKTQHKYGIMIAARNEEIVIGNLIDSIFEQNYPRDLIEVFVVADNSTDNTAKIAKEHGAIVFERNDTNHRGKSYALDFMIKKILSNHKYDDIEAFFVFDADNILSKDYLSHMNDVFDAGYEVSTSFRDSKNFDSSLASASSSLIFYRECLLVHHSRQNLNLSTFISGTGYFISRRIISELGGWNFNTLTEDIEFSCWCAYRNIKIGYNQEAVFYDEQPNKFKVSDKQRFRWSKGCHQCFAIYGKELLRNTFGFTKRSLSNRISSFEMFVHVCPFPIIATGWFILNICLHAIFLGVGLENINDFNSAAIGSTVIELISLFGIAWIHAIISMIKYGKYIRAKMAKKICSVFIFPFFVAMFIPLSFIALFKKDVAWTPIVHNENISMKDLEKANAK